MCYLPSELPVLICPCLMASLDVFTCVFSSVASVMWFHVSCTSYVCMFTLACRDHTLFCLGSQVMCIVPPYAVIFVCGISWLS